MNKKLLQLIRGRRLSKRVKQEMYRALESSVGVAGRFV